MVKANIDDYFNFLDDCEVAPDPTHNYGLTESDVKRIEENPKRYLEFAIYLLSREWYEGAGDDEHVFDNSDAMIPSEVSLRLNELVNSALK